MAFRSPFAGLLVGLALALTAACAGDAGSRADAGGATCPPPPASDVRPTLPPDSGAPVPPTDASADISGASWTLPPCEAACDRLVDCAVPACPGFEWTTAGLLAGDCHAVCDDGFVTAVAAAADCEAVLAGPGAGVAVLSERCEENPCDFSCGWLAQCLVSECPAFGASLEEPVREDCVRTCVPDEISWVTGFATCADLVAAITSADAAFREDCQGVPDDCADAESCDPYAARIASCFVENCEGQADDYETGLRWLFADFCRNGEPCTSARDVAVILDPALTCTDSPLGEIGAYPPFDGLCLGTNGVLPAAVREACGEVMACAGTGWLPDVDACMAMIALQETAAAITACVGAAEGCGQLFECFPEEK